MAGTPPGPPPFSPQLPSAPLPGAHTTGNGLAAASLVCSCAGLFIGFFGTVPGIICGIKALGRIRRTPGLGGKGLANAGLVTGCVVSLLWIPLTFVLVMGIINGFRVASQIQARPGVQSVGQGVSLSQPTNTDVAADLAPDGSGWLADLEGVSIPDAPVSGRIQGLPFTAQEVEVDPTSRSITFSYDNSGTERSSATWKIMRLSLEFTQRNTRKNPEDMDAVEYFNDKSLGNYSQRTLSVQKDDAASVQPAAEWSFEKPDLRMVWLEPGTGPLRDRMNDTLSAPYRYALRLEFDELKNGKLPGRIYLCVLDRKKSFLCGKFVARVKENAQLPRDIQPDAAGWTLDLKDAAIPETPVAGRISGIAFKAQSVEMEGSGLTFRQGVPPHHQAFRLNLRDSAASRRGQQVNFTDASRFSGQTIVVTGKGGFFELPGLDLWSPGLGSHAEPNAKYVMRLELGEYQDGKMPGRIYLCVLDRDKSFICGKFEARVPAFPGASQ